MKRKKQLIGQHARKTSYQKAGVNILHYSQIKYLGKVSIFWYFGEEFPHFYQCFKTLFQILMKNANNFVESMIYALLLGKSFSLTFGKCFLGFRKIFTPVQYRINSNPCGL